MLVFECFDTELSPMPKSDVLHASLERVLASLRPTYHRLLAHGKIPPDARALRMSTEHFQAVLKLHLSVFDTGSGEVMLRLAGHSTVVKYDLNLSTVLLLGEDVIGTTLVLAQPDTATAYIYAIIVHTLHRRTWATAYLKFHSLAHLATERFHSIAFEALAGNSDTLRHAAKVDAESVACGF